MAIHKTILEDGCLEYRSDGEHFWITVFDSNGFCEKSVTYWRDPPGGSEWSLGPFETLEEAIRAGENTARF